MSWSTQDSLSTLAWINVFIHWVLFSLYAFFILSFFPSRSFFNQNQSEQHLQYVIL